MKQFTFLLLLFVSTLLNGQSDNAFFSALKTSDMSVVESYLEDEVEFCLFEDQQILNKKTAINKLRTFLGAYKITGVEVMHKGVSKNKSSQYKVAKINTSTETFRVFVYSSGEIGLKTVKEIRIDKF